MNLFSSTGIGNFEFEIERNVLVDMSLKANGLAKQLHRIFS